MNKTGISSVDNEFADDRPGLHYKAINFTALRKPIFALDDGRPTLWIDLRSVCECIGVSWRRCDLIVKSQRAYLKTEGCFDRAGRETELIEADRLLRWLDSANRLFQQHSSAAVQRVVLLRKAWRSEWADAAQGAYPDKAVVPEARAKPAVRRKSRISSGVVESLYRLRQQGRSFPAASLALGISLSAAKKIASGSYPTLPADALEAWDRTFGVQAPAVTPAKRAYHTATDAGVA